MLFSRTPAGNTSVQGGGAAGSVMRFQYSQTVQEEDEAPEPMHVEEVVQEPEVRLPEEAFARRLAEERALGEVQAEARLRRDHEQNLAHEREKVAETLRSFELTRKEYFAKVEGEVVQLALSIAKKILHREAQVDPLLIMALVQIALGQIKEGSAVSVRVRPEEVSRWRDQLGATAINLEVTVIADSDLKPGDCVLETELGSVNFSMEAQLKEVEQGFLDVLARTPQR